MVASCPASSTVTKFSRAPHTPHMDEPKLTRRRVLAGSGVAALLAAAWVFDGGDVAVDDWRMYGFDAENTGYSGGAGAVGGLRERWTASTEAPVYSTPAVADGVVYASLYTSASPRDIEPPAMQAYDSASGDVLWSAPEEVNMLEASTPAVVDDRVYATAWGDVVALDRANGDLVWRRDLESPSQHSATVHDGAVYASTNAATVEAYGAGDGERLWRTEVEGSVVQTAPAVTDDAVYVAGRLEGGSGAAVVALDASDGEQRWRYEVEGGTPSPVAVAGDTAYVAVDRGGVHALSTAVSPDSRVRWTWTPSEADGRTRQASPAVTEDEVVVVADGFYALDTETGETAWSETSPEVFGAHNDKVPSPSVVGDTVLTATGGRTVYAVSLSSGEISATVETEDSVFGSVGAGDGAVFFGDGEGVHAYDARSSGLLDRI